MALEPAGRPREVNSTPCAFEGGIPRHGVSSASAGEPESQFGENRRGDQAVRLRGNRWSFGLSSVGVVVVLALVSTLAVPGLKGRFSRAEKPWEGLATTAVRRTDMHV